jgi:hypothetical protein
MSALTPANWAHASSSAPALSALRRSLASALLALCFANAALAQDAASDAPAVEGAAAHDDSTTATAAEPAPETSAEGEPVFTLGPLEYRAARGLKFGDSGLTLGGFTTFELERPDEGATALALDNVNLLALYEPVESFRVFAELEVGDLLFWQSGESVDSSPHANFERLYVEYSHSDALNVRFGKFLTPVGQWNLVSAEPFVWTATQPAIVELGLDEHQTGVAVFGSLYPAKRRVSYWLYGQVIDAFDVQSDETPAARSVGARLETSDARGEWTLGGSLLASRLDGAWSTTGGVDAKWRGQRLELSAEILASGGDIPGRDYWGAFVEAAHPLDLLSPRLAKLYLVGRVEHYDPSGERSTELIDFGLTWLPRDWLNLKAGYRAAIHDRAGLRDGIKFSISVLF